MAIAQVDPLAEPETDEAFYANARHVLKTLMAWRDMDADELAERAGIKRSTFYTRIAETKPSKFLGGELNRLARELGVKPMVFFEPADSLLEPGAITRWTTDSPALEVIETPGAVQQSFRFDATLSVVE